MEKKRFVDYIRDAFWADPFSGKGRGKPIEPMSEDDFFDRTHGIYVESVLRVDFHWNWRHNPPVASQTFP